MGERLEVEGFYNDDPRVEDSIFKDRQLYDLEYLREGISRPVNPGVSESLVAVDDPHRAVLVTSKVKDAVYHFPCFDFDIPFGTVKVVESASGHAHLYINQRLSWEECCVLMDAFEKVGLLERGWVKACKGQGMMRLRMPGVKKVQPRWAGYKGDEDGEGSDGEGEDGAVRDDSHPEGCGGVQLPD